MLFSTRPTKLWMVSGLQQTLRILLLPMLNSSSHRATTSPSLHPLTLAVLTTSSSLTLLLVLPILLRTMPLLHPTKNLKKWSRAITLRWVTPIKLTLTITCRLPRIISNNQVTQLMAEATWMRREQQTWEKTILIMEVPVEAERRKPWPTLSSRILRRRRETETQEWIWGQTAH